MDVLRGAAVGLLALILVAGCGGEPPPLSAEQQALFREQVDAEIVVRTAKNAMRYETLRIEAPAGATVRLVIDNSASTSPAMVHNVVVVLDQAAIDRVGRAAAGVPGNIPDDRAILAFTPLAGPGERFATVFRMPPPGEYPYLCTYPGHFQFMQGTLVSTAS